MGNFSDKKTECINAYSLEKVIEEFDSIEKDENGYDTVKAFRLNRRYRELTGQNHEGYAQRVLKECEEASQSQFYTDTYKKFYLYLKKEILDGKDYITIIDDDVTFRRKLSTNPRELTDEEIDYLLGFFNDIPVLIKDEISMPFENLSRAIYLSEEYFYRNNVYHPTFVEHALDILGPIVSHSEGYSQSGIISSFVLDLMYKSLRKIHRKKTEEQKIEGTSD